MLEIVVSKGHSLSLGGSYTSGLWMRYAADLTLRLIDGTRRSAS